MPIEVYMVTEGGGLFRLEQRGQRIWTGVAAEPTSLMDTGLALFDNGTVELFDVHHHSHVAMGDTLTLSLDLW